MAEPLAPVDTAVKLPPSVAAAATAANAAHATAYPMQEPAAPEPAAPEPAAGTPPPAPAAPVQLSTPEQRAGVDANSPEGRLYAMEGRYKQAMRDNGMLQEQLREMGDELIRWQDADPRTRGPRPVDNSLPAHMRAPVPAPDIRLLTDEDVKTFGPELIDLAKRAAQEVMAPQLTQVSQQTQQVARRVQGNATQRMQEYLDREVPEWRTLNKDPRFISWARSQDVYSGQVRGVLLKSAYQAAEAPRVAEFFKGFQREEVATGNAPGVSQPEPAAQPPRQAAVALETFTAPGRPKPATGAAALPADKPVFTRAQIKGFYDQVRKGAYIGRPEDKARDEALLFAAQQDGRVRG